MRKVLPLLAAALLADFAGAGSGRVAVPDGGTFSVYAGGREAGQESFEVEERGAAVALRSRATLYRDDREQTLSLSLLLDADGRLREFSATGEQDGVTRVATLAVDGGRLRGEIREGEVSRVVDLAGAAGVAVVAEPFTAPWVFLVARYDLSRGGPQTFPAVFPLEGREGEVVVTFEEEEALDIDGRVVLASRLHARPSAGDSVNLWLDEDGRLVVAARSVAGLSALRGGRARIGLKPGEDPPDPEGVATTRVRFAADPVTLSGSILKPAAGEGPFPAVLLLSGSGPQDRNGNAPGSEVQWSHLHAFAVALARRGIASLRYDERGVATSAGSFAEATFSDLASDAGHALDYLASREDVDPGRIAVLGHSEGALLAARLARRGDLRGLVFLGAPADPLDRILVEQARQRVLRRGRSEAEAGQVAGRMRAFFEHVRLSRTDVLRWEGRDRDVGWLREHLDLDPAGLYRWVSCPVLLLHGERDLQVPVGQAERVAGSLPPGTPREVRRLPGLDHFLIPSRDGIEDYGQVRRRVDPQATEAVAGFLATCLDR